MITSWVGVERVVVRQHYTNDFAWLVMVEDSKYVSWSDGVVHSMSGPYIYLPRNWKLICYG